MLFPRSARQWGVCVVDANIASQKMGSRDKAAKYAS